MRFARRSCTTLQPQPAPPHQTPRRTRGELSLHTHDPNGASAFIPDDRSSDNVYHLRFAGNKDISLSSKLRLVKVNLVRQSGAPAFTGNCMVNMLPRENPLSDTVIFVSDGCQTIPLSGSINTDLEPSYLLGASCPPLVQILFTTLGHPSLHPFPPPPTPGVHALLDNTPDADKSPSTADLATAPKAPCPQLLARVDADQRKCFLDLWKRLTLRLLNVNFNLHGSGWTPSVIDNLGDVLCELQDVFSTSKADFGSCSLIPIKITVPSDSAPVTSRPYRIDPILANKADPVIDQLVPGCRPDLLCHVTTNQPCGRHLQKGWMEVSASLSTTRGSTPSAPSDNSPSPASSSTPWAKAANFCSLT